MKKFAFALLLLVLLTGLPGCKTTRATHKTDTKQEVRQTVATDSNRAEKVTTSEQINAVLLNSEKQNVVIAFDEWEYYPAVSDTITGENYAQISGNSMRTRTNGEADKPPNAGSVKKHRTGTITINAEKQTEQTSEKQTTTTADTKTDVKTKTKTDIKTKEKTKTIETNSKGNGVFWFVVIFVFVVLLVCIVIVRNP